MSSPTGNFWMLICLNFRKEYEISIRNYWSNWIVTLQEWSMDYFIKKSCFFNSLWSDIQYTHVLPQYYLISYNINNILPRNLLIWIITLKEWYMNSSK
jgi:hypothetical protein